MTSEISAHASAHTMLLLAVVYVTVTLAVVTGHLAYSLWNGRPFPSIRAIVIALLLWPVWAVSTKAWRRVYPPVPFEQEGGGE